MEIRAKFHFNDNFADCVGRYWLGWRDYLRAFSPSELLVEIVKDIIVLA